MTKEELDKLRIISDRFDDLKPCNRKSPSSDFISWYILNHIMPNGDIDVNLIRDGMTACRNCGVQDCPVTQLRDFVSDTAWEMSLKEDKWV